MRPQDKDWHGSSDGDIPFWPGVLGMATLAAVMVGLVLTLSRGCVW